MNRTRITFDWNDGHVRSKELSRSFKTLKEAEEFASSKDTRDIYTNKGKYVVVWVKKTAVN